MRSQVEFYHRQLRVQAPEQQRVLVAVWEAYDLERDLFHMGLLLYLERLNGSKNRKRANPLKGSPPLFSEFIPVEER